MARPSQCIRLHTTPANTKSAGSLSHTSTCTEDCPWVPRQHSAALLSEREDNRVAEA
ncbi:hypothetical protein DPMN_182591 [Dreissena polymorpha]|uniref:Uncharacterized protein n=1 Tax=Dreissena polymorpha TaxID=45954 RepID=A0A9D4DF35_DREPO|nr:hypothetical protein DPMN_182591 [Dreissena polymorpha]